MMKVDEPPSCGGGGEIRLQPLSLGGEGCASVGFIRIAVDHKEMHRPANEVIITLVIRELEIVQIRRCPRRYPIMVPKGREKSVDGGACSVSSRIRKDEFVVILADILVDRGCTSGFIVVISDGDDEIGVPTFHKRRHVGFGLTCEAVISDDSEPDGRLRGRPRRKNQLNRGEQNESRLA